MKESNFWLQLVSLHLWLHFLFSNMENPQINVTTDEYSLYVYKFKIDY